jgi:hypothetical protein
MAGGLEVKEHLQRTRGASRRYKIALLAIRKKTENPPDRLSPATCPHHLPRPLKLQVSRATIALN